MIERSHQEEPHLIGDGVTSRGQVVTTQKTARTDCKVSHIASAASSRADRISSRRAASASWGLLSSNGHGLTTPVWSVCPFAGRTLSVSPETIVFGRGHGWLSLNATRRPRTHRNPLPKPRRPETWRQAFLVPAARRVLPLAHLGTA